MTIWQQLHTHNVTNIWIFCSFESRYKAYLPAVQTNNISLKCIILLARSSNCTIQFKLKDQADSLYALENELAGQVSIIVRFVYAAQPYYWLSQITNTHQAL